MPPLTAWIKVRVSDLAAVQNLVREADMAVQILGSEEGEVAEAVKDGLETALEDLRKADDE